MTITIKSKKSGKRIILSDGGKGTMGRPRISVDIGEVFKLARLGCTLAEAASFLGICIDTLYDRLREEEYREAWERGWDVGKISIRRKQIEVATAGKGNAIMLIWLGKQMLGQSEKAHMSISTDRNVDLSRVETETAQIPWTEGMDEELNDIEKVIELGKRDYEFTDGD